MAHGSRWLRLYTEIYRDPKVSKLSDRLFRFWIGCLCLAAEHDGIIPIHTDVAYYLRLPANKVLENLLELKKHGLLDDSANKRFMPHNWHGRQYESDTSAARMKRFRERKRAELVASPVTSLLRHRDVIEQTQIQNRTDTDTEQSMDAREFAERFPDQSDQNATVQEYLSLVAPSEKAAVFACLERYKASEQVSRGVFQSGRNWLMAQKANGWNGQWAPPKLTWEQARAARWREEDERETKNAS